MDWPGLLKWSMKNTDGKNLVDKDLKLMTEEDAKFFEEAMESCFMNEMKEIMKILDKLKLPEEGTEKDEKERCFLIEDLLILLDGLENSRNLVRAKRFEELINYFFNTKYKEVMLGMAGILTSMMQNDTYVQDAAVRFNLFNILNIINETNDKQTLGKCIYILSGLVYGDNLNTKLIFLEKYDGISLLYNLIIKNKENFPVFRRILNILRDLTKIEDNDSDLNQIRLKSLLKIIDLKINDLLLNFIKNISISDEDKENYENNLEIRGIIYDILINICKSFDSLKEIFEVLTTFNDLITKSNLPEEAKKNEKTMILDTIKRLKAEYNRKEEIIHNDKSNLEKLDHKATLLKLKKEEKTEENSKINEVSNTSNQSVSPQCVSAVIQNNHPNLETGIMMFSLPENKNENK